MVLVLSIAVASLSWFAIERPLNNLKRYFPYLSAAMCELVCVTEAL